MFQYGQRRSVTGMVNSRSGRGKGLVSKLNAIVWL